MRMLEVVSQADRKDFLTFPLSIYQSFPAWIQPLNTDIESVFDPTRNKTFKHGECVRWLLKDASEKTIGRLAAFVNQKTVMKGNDQPTGGVGFFECIENKEAAFFMLNHGKAWLQSKGMEAMDGPINFGDRDKWWGLMVEGFEAEPMYGMSFNPSYYASLLTNYGFENYYNQFYYRKNLLNPLPARFEERYHKFKSKPDYTAVHLDKKHLEKYAQDFVTIYNSAWAQHGEEKAITLPQIIKLFNSLKAVMDERVIWFAYYKEEPIAMFINIPDVNQYFKYFNGALGLWQKLHLLWMKWRGQNNKLTGLAFGVVPKYQALGIDSFLINSCHILLNEIKLYDEYEMGWAGDWNPKMVNIYKSLDANPSRRMVTFRYIFDAKSHPFERHPVMDYKTGG